MYRVIVLYEQEPDSASYAEHVEVCKQVPSSVFRHGKITGAPMGDATHAYYAEWEFTDADAFKTATRSDESGLARNAWPGWSCIVTTSLACTTSSSP